MRVWHGKLFLFAGFVCLLMISLRYTSKSDNLPFQLREVYERLLRAEHRGEVLSQELLKVLNHLQNGSISPSNLSISNSSEFQKHSSVLFIIKLDLFTPPSLQIVFGATEVADAILETRVLRLLLPSQPNALVYLPHLKHHEDSLKPIVHLGQRRSGVSMVFGVPTVQRQKQSYLVNTLQSLLYDLSTADRKQILIVVFVAETNETFVKTVVQSVQSNLPDAVSSGVIEVISPSPYFYPDLTDLKETFGDPKERVRWRTKQNLDYSFLMLYAQSKGAYYIQLEDDLVAKSGFLESMKQYTEQVLYEEWLFLEFSQLGFIGKLFRSSDLPMIVEFILMFHKDKPIDWLLDHFLWVKVCNPERDAKQCDNEKSRLKRTFKPSLFQHVGLHSSLAGKIQNLKDKDFGKQVLFKGHSENPSASLSSSLQDYMSHSLEKAYRGDDFFWGLSPKRGDYVLITFTKPQNVKGYLFRSGNIETNGDRFYNTTVEVLPVKESVREKVLRGELQCCKPSTDGFIQIGSFQNGVAEGELDGTLEALQAIRLLVHSDSDVWVLLSEIYIKV